MSILQESEEGTVVERLDDFMRTDAMIIGNPLFWIMAVVGLVCWLLKLYLDRKPEASRSPVGDSNSLNVDQESDPEQLAAEFDTVAGDFERDAMGAADCTRLAARLRRLGWRPAAGTQAARFAVALSDFDLAIAQGSVAYDSLMAKAKATKHKWIDAINSHGLSGPTNGIHSAIEALGRLGDPRAIPFLLEVADGIDCDTNSWMLPKEADKALGLMRVGASEGLRSALRDPSGHGRAAAARALGRIEGATAADILEGVLSDNDPAVVKEAATCLGSIGSGTATPGLLLALKRVYPDDTYGLVRRSVAEALGELRDARAVEGLLECLGGTGSETQLYEVIVSALGKIGDSRAFKPLLEELRNTGRYSNALRLALAATASSTSTQQLIACLGDTQVSGDAVLILSKIGDASAVLPLLVLAKNQSSKLLHTSSASKAMKDVVAAENSRRKAIEQGFCVVCIEEMLVSKEAHLRAIQEGAFPLPGGNADIDSSSACSTLIALYSILMRDATNCSNEALRAIEEQAPLWATAHTHGSLYDDRGFVEIEPGGETICYLDFHGVSSIARKELARRENTN